MTAALGGSQEVAAFQKSIDRDANGKISFKEYMNWVLGNGWAVEGTGNHNNNIALLSLSDGWQAGAATRQ